MADGGTSGLSRFLRRGFLAESQERKTACADEKRGRRGWALLDSLEVLECCARPKGVKHSSVLVCVVDDLRRGDVGVGGHEPCSFPDLFNNY
jgi:hypothetical protein